MSATKNPIICFLLLACLFTQLLPIVSNDQPPKPKKGSSRISVVGVVYCDVCYMNTFTKHSFFLPGVDVNIQCKFNANAPRTSEHISVSVNRTTDKFGAYMLDIPSVDGVNCFDGHEIASFCQATLISSATPMCNAPGLRSTASKISAKSKHENLCIFSLNALSYRPQKKNTTLCGNKKVEAADSLSTSKFFLPYFPPYGYPRTSSPQVPFPSMPLPPLPPLPSLPPLPFPSLPYPNPNPDPNLKPPSLPFPFPTLPPNTPLLNPPPLPAFNITDPRTWFPNFPFLSPPPPPPPAFNSPDPNTGFPFFPPLAPPPARPQRSKP